jgi:hypothetical protein
MKQPSQCPRQDVSEGRLDKQSSITRLPGALPDPKVGAVDTFISLAEKSRTPEERRARIESVLKLLGLPSIDEVNRMDREANARASRERTRDDTA